MKRLALAILLVTAVAASAFVVLNRPSAQANPDVTITVNTFVDPVSENDYLSLREAMMLATGDLKLVDLTQAECDHVSTATWRVNVCFSYYPPGAASADTIEFASLIFDPAYIFLDSALPILDTGNDTIDASSSSTAWIVDGGGKYIWCFYINSDNNTIKGLGIFGCIRGVNIIAGASRAQW